MKSTKKAVIASTVLIVLVVFVPGLVLTLTGVNAADGAGVLGAFAGLFAALLGGWRVGLLLVVPLGVATGLAVAFSDQPWLAALLLLVVAGTRDWLAIRGLHNALTTAVIAVVFMVSDPPAQTTSLPDPVFVGLVVAAATLYGAGVVALMRRGKPPHTSTSGVPRGRAEVFAATNGLLMGVATWFVVQLQVGHSGAWLLMTIVLVSQPYIQDGFDKALQRAGGTILGFAVAFTIGAVTSTTAILYSVGMAALMAACVLMLQHRPYWAYAACLTVAIVMLEGASTSVADTATSRLFATLIGAGAALAVTAALQPYAKRTAKQLGLTHY